MSGLSPDYTVIDATDLKGVRNVISNRLVITGFVSVADIGLIPYQGALERDFLETKDFDRQLSYVGAQPLRLIFREGNHHRYTPDYLCRYKPKSDGTCESPILYEIKPRSELRKNWDELRPGFLRASALCRSRGWRFRIATERCIRTPRLARIKFLRSFLDRPDIDCIGQILYRTMNDLVTSTPAELLATGFASKERRLQAVGILWKLVADGRIKIELDKPLNMESKIWSMLNASSQSNTS
jgi:hypothetical protein